MHSLVVYHRDTTAFIFEIVSKISSNIYVLKLWCASCMTQSRVGVVVVTQLTLSAVMHINAQQLPMYLPYSFEYKTHVYPTKVEKRAYASTTQSGVREEIEHTPTHAKCSHAPCDKNNCPQAIVKS
jgi:hypothetical protein